MREATEYARREPIGSKEALLAVIRQHPAIAGAIPEAGWELQLPRIFLKTMAEDREAGARARSCWVARCWWRSGTGSLDYYAEINLSEGMLMAFRTLPGSGGTPERAPVRDRDGYLQSCVRALGGYDREASEALERQWEDLVPEDLRQAAREKPARRSFHGWHLPLETLLQWDPETLMRHALDRYGLTPADLKDEEEES